MYLSRLWKLVFSHRFIPIPPAFLCFFLSLCLPLSGKTSQIDVCWFKILSVGDQACPVAVAGFWNALSGRLIPASTENFSVLAILLLLTLCEPFSSLNYLGHRKHLLIHSVNCITISVVCVCDVYILVPSKVDTLSVRPLSNSSLYIVWTAPLQPNGLVTG